MPRREFLRTRGFKEYFVGILHFNVLLKGFDSKIRNLATQNTEKERGLLRLAGGFHRKSLSFRLNDEPEFRRLPTTWLDCEGQSEKEWQKGQGTDFLLIGFHFFFPSFFLAFHRSLAEFVTFMFNIAVTTSS